MKFKFQTFSPSPPRTHITFFDFCKINFHMSKQFLYIFLDIDGVLATSKEYFIKPKSNLWNKEYNIYNLNKECVSIFNEILSKITNYRIVLSSDWRENYNIESMNKFFRINGLNCDIYDYTKIIKDQIEVNSIDEGLKFNRAHEILEYVHTNNIKYYIILDDLDLSNFIQSHNYIKVPRASEGLKQINLKNKIINHLSETFPQFCV